MRHSVLLLFASLFILPTPYAADSQDPLDIEFESGALEQAPADDATGAADDTLPTPEEAVSTPLDAPSGRARIVPLDRIIAIVNDDVITQSDLEAQVRTVVLQMRQQKAQIPPEDVLYRQVLERLILRRLQLQVAELTGIRVDDDTLNAAVENIAKQNKLTLAQFRQVLTRDGYDFAAFREDIRQEIIISRLRQRQVGNRITVTDQEVENFLSTQDVQDLASETEYQLAQILIALPAEPSSDQVQAAQKKAEQVLESLRDGADFRETAIAESQDQRALEGGDLGWLTAAKLPSLFAEHITKMSPGDLSEVIRSGNGFHIIKLLDKRSNTGGTVRQTRARHILIRTNEIVTDQDAQTRLEQLKQRIEGGEDFAVLARSHSEDPGTAGSGGDIGWRNPGELGPNFDAVLNTLQPGAVSDPFQTDFGWHIIQIVEQRDHDNTEDIIKTKAREAIRQRKTEEETVAWLRRMRDEAYVEYKVQEE
jgi:peptidyl-prolyl cis-trans isomerase SurA